MIEVFRAGLPDRLSFPGLFKEPAIILNILIVFSFVVTDALFRDRLELGEEEAGLLGRTHEDIGMLFQVMEKRGCAAPAHSDDQEIRQPYRPAFFNEGACFSHFNAA